MYQLAKFSPLLTKRPLIEPVTTDAAIKLLLHGNGNFLDHSQSQRAMTASGTMQISTSQKKFGSGSLYCPTNGGYLTTTTTTDFEMTGDFTLDFWIRANDIAGGTMRMVDSGGGAPYFELANGKAQFLNGSILLGPTTTVLANNTFYHLAITRSGTAYRLFLNGTQEGSASDSINNNFNLIRVGGRHGTSDAWMDEVRLVKGRADWTANFTPSAVPYT